VGLSLRPDAASSASGLAEPKFRKAKFFETQRFQDIRYGKTPVFPTPFPRFESDKKR
jgi:hypothetical protein